jgi:protoporphyrinogen oxidase
LIQIQAMKANMTAKPETIIIGAGVAGLAAAWDLVHAGHQVTIYEAGERVGGLASGFKDEQWDWELEKFYHHWFEGDRHILNLIREIGAGDRILFPRPKTSFWINGKLVRSEIELTSVLNLPLSRRGLLHFAFGGALVRLMPWWRLLENFSADEWMRHYMGTEGYEMFFKPLMIGKFGESYQQVNMAWMWARVKARSLRLGTFEGGFQHFLNQMAAALTERGVSIQTGTPIEQIGLDALRPTITVKGVTRTVDHVISTVSPRLMLNLTPRLVDTHYGDQMAELQSIGGVCVVFALRNQLMRDGTYWLNLPARSPDYRENEFPYLALVEHTNYMDRAHYGGDHIIYCGDYVAPDHEYFSMSEQQLVDHFLPSLRKINPDFSPEWVRKWWVWRAPYAQPVPGIRHSEKIPALQTPLPGVYWASMSQVYPWDRGTNFAVELGRRVARIVLGQHKNTNAVID